MELIRDVINFIATDLGDFGATLAPYAFIGMVGLSFSGIDQTEQSVWYT